MLQINRLRNVIIGREEDGGVQIVKIDCTEWLRAYPNLTNYRIEVMTPDGLVYMPVVHMDGVLLVWPITQSDTATKGKGMYQIVATGEDGFRKTSDHLALIILDVMTGTAQDTPPDPSKPWTEKVLEAADRAEDAAKRAEAAGGGGTPGADGEDGGYYAPSVNETGFLTWQASKADMPIISGTNIKGPTGEPGPKGEPGEAGKDGHTPVKGNDYYTDEDKAEMVSAVLGSLKSEEWTFSLVDGSTVTKKVVVQ